MPARAVLRTTGTTLLLMVAGVVPFVGVFAFLLAPLPLALLMTREKWVAAVPTLVVSASLFFFIGGLWAGMLAVAWLFSFGVIIGSLARGDHPFRKVVAYGSIIGAALFATWLILLNVIGGVDLYGDGIQFFREVLDAESPILNELLNAQAVESVKETLPEISRQIPYLIPTAALAFLLASATSVSAGAIWLLERNQDISSRRIPAFTLWRVPWYLSWVFVLALAGATVPELMGASPWLVDLLEGLGNGALLIVGPFYLVQGAAIVTYYIRKRSQSSVLLGAGIVLLLFIPLLSQAVLFLGLFDTWFDLRRLEKGEGQVDSEEETSEGS